MSDCCAPAATRSLTRSQEPRTGFNLLAGVAGLGAATLEAQELEIGVRGGYGRSNEVTTTIICALECGPSRLSHHFPRNAPVGAIVLRHQRTERLALRGELAFAPKGYGPGDERSGWRIAAQYLEASVLVDVALLPIGTGQLMLSGGLAPAVLLSCQVSGTTVEGWVRAGCGEGVRYAPDLAYDLGWAIAPELRRPTGSGDILRSGIHAGCWTSSRPTVEAAPATTRSPPR